MVSMSPAERDQVFQLRLSAAERKMLDKLADQRGLMASDFIRLMLREAQQTKPGAGVAGERDRLATRLSMAWEDVDRIAAAATKREREQRAIDAHSALAHATVHINSILTAVGMAPLPDREDD